MLVIKFEIVSSLSNIKNKQKLLLKNSYMCIYFLNIKYNTLFYLPFLNFVF